MPVGHGKSFRLIPWSFSAPEAGVLIIKIAQLLDKIRPRPVKFSPAVVPAFFELGGGEPLRARIARTSVLERAAATPPIPVGELNPSALVPYLIGLFVYLANCVSPF